MSEMTDEELPASPEYGFGGAAYARARKLKQKEMQAQAWHDANVGVPDELFALRASDDLKHAREVLSAYDQLVDDLRAENARLKELLRKARGAMDGAIEKDDVALVTEIDAALKAAPQ